MAWRLRNTHGIPLELTVTLAAQRGLQVDIAGFDLLVAQGRVSYRNEISHWDTFLRS